MKAAGDMRQYRKVYLLLADEDPRKAGPRIARRLEAMGFEVVGVNEGEGIGRAQGTGFVVGTNGQILTCAHVVGTNDLATLWIAGQRREARVTRRDETVDLALLEFSDSGPPPPPLAFSSATNYSLGQDVFTLGFPLTDLLGTSPRLTKGLVSATVGTNDQPTQLQVSAEVQPGNSGGPLLGSKAEVLGVISSTLNPLRVLQKTGGTLPQNVNFAIKGNVARDFLAGADVKLTSAPVSVAEEQPFEVARNSVALVRPGIIPPGREKEPEMVCAFAYRSRWDMWFRFLAFHVELYDLRSGQQLLEAGVYRDDMVSSEDAVIDRTFSDIQKAIHGELAPPAKIQATKSTPTKSE